MFKKYLLAAALGLALPVAVNAADNAENKGIDKMAKDLGLSDDQKAQVQTIITKEKQTVEGIFKDQEQKLKLAQEQTKASLQQVLTADQMAKLEKKMQEQAAKHAKKKK